MKCMKFDLLLTFYYERISKEHDDRQEYFRQHCDFNFEL